MVIAFTVLTSSTVNPRNDMKQAWDCFVNTELALRQETAMVSNDAV